MITIYGYTIADLHNMAIDLCGRAGVFLLDWIGILINVAFVLGIFYIGYKVGKRESSKKGGK